MIKIVMPLDPKLTAQNRGHWSTYAKNIKAAKEAAYYLAMAAPNKPIKGRAIIDIRFFVPDEVQRDELNMVYSCKPLIDGVVAAKMIQGDHWKMLGTGSIDTVLGSSPKGVVTVELTFRRA